MEIIVLSDIHLGVDKDLAECIENKPLLIAFLEKIGRDMDVDEVVINGDFFDQWFFPGDATHAVDSHEFYKEVAVNNPDVIAAFRSLMSQGIRLVYVPGNHDMTLPEETLEEILPGIVQARDARGLGRYRTGQRNEIMIEHSHRYEFSCAPDPISNKEFMKYGDPILPYGYFYTRIGVTSSLEGYPKITKDLSELNTPPKKDEDQLAAYHYTKLWEILINLEFPVRESLDDKFIKVAVDGFQMDVCLNDLLPVEKDGKISANLYKDLQQHWQEIQKINQVPNPDTALLQMQEPINQELRIERSKTQYFDLDPTVDVVVFGHTHLPAYREFEGYNRKKIFVNDGSWVDSHMGYPKDVATFVKISSDKDDTTVSLLKCEGKNKVENIVKVQNDFTSY